MKSFIHKELSYKVLGSAFKVHNALGPGLAENAYQGALVIEFQRSSIEYELQKSYPLYYQDHLVGNYVADIVVANTIILELKSVNRFTSGMSSQLINYIKLSGLSVGYLINFYPRRLEWHRFVYTDKQGP